MKNVFRILGYARNFKKYAVLNVLFNMLSIVFNVFSITLLIPLLDIIFQKGEEDYIKYIEQGVPAFEFSAQYAIDKFYFELSSLIMSTPDEGKSNALVFICLLVFLGIFFKNLFRYLAQYFIAPLRNGIMQQLRNKVYGKSLELPLAYYSKERKGDIIARMTNDAQEIEWTVLTSIEMIFRDPITITVILTFLIAMSPNLTLFVFILLPVSGAIIGSIGGRLKRTAKKGQGKMGELVAMIEETLTGLRIIKAFNAEGFSKKKFTKMNETYKRFMVRMYRQRDLASPLSEFLGVSVILTIVWFGGNIVLSGEEGLEASTFIGYIAVFSQLISPSKSITVAFFNVQKAAASAERIDKILSAENPIKEIPNAKSISEFNHNIEYRNVSFAYNTENVLDTINLKVEKGKTIALAGHSGGGKTTLADLLPRFYDPTEGEILIDGIPIKQLKIENLRGFMGVVTQQSILFNDTVFNNIAFGLNGAKQQDVEEAAKIANAHEFIIEMENGYETNIGDMGTKLSGGQRQRLSIARAIMKNPPILILDEATSALDTESERLVQEALNNLMKNRTSLVIAHRLSTIQNADEIIVLDKGKIAERGTHSDLLQQNGMYKKLCDLQMFS